MKLKTLITLLAVTAMIVLVSACSLSEEATPEAADAADAGPPQPRVVSAEAFVVPMQEADLAFEVGGQVVALEIKEGDEVESGAILAQVDDSTQQANIADAKAYIAETESIVAATEAQVTEAEVGLAGRVAGLAEAEANLAKVKAGPTAEDIAQLEANLAAAEAALAEIISGSTAEEVAQADAAVQSARAGLNEVLAAARDEDLQAASSTLLQAQADVRKAQADYDRVRYGNSPDVETVGTALEKATLAYESAQATFDKLVNGATAEQIATAQAAVAEAEAARDTVLAGATPEQIAQVQANVEAAQASLDKLLAGATDEDIAIAEASVESAQANVEAGRALIETNEANVERYKAMVMGAQAKLASAEIQLNKTILIAPFAGKISSLNIEMGEIAQAGAPIIALGAAGWQVETDDLTEIDIVDVQLGSNVTISVDALPGESFSGVVSRITPKSEVKAGDVTYTVLIDLTDGPTERLKWGMTTFVDIEADSGIAR